jgi:hypothetical protein
MMREEELRRKQEPDNLPTKEMKSLRVSEMMSSGLVKSKMVLFQEFNSSKINKTKQQQVTQIWLIIMEGLLKPMSTQLNSLKV